MSIVTQHTHTAMEDIVDGPFEFEAVTEDRPSVDDDDVAAAGGFDCGVGSVPVSRYVVCRCVVNMNAASL